MSFDVRVMSDEGPAQSVPVTWIGPDRRMPALSEADDVLVTGAIHRRFYRAGAVLQSRVDLRAAKIVAGTDRKRRTALVKYLKTLDVHVSEL